MGMTVLVTNCVRGKLSPMLGGRQPRVQMRLFEKAEPGESVQVDVKYMRIAGRWAFQYTALDDCTRFRVLRLYRRLHPGSSLAFLTELRRALPFPIKRVQSDHGQEFSLAFVLGSRPPGSDTDTFGPGARSRTAESSGAIGSTTRSSGGGIASRTSRRPLKLSEAGRPDTTTSASPSRSTVVHPPKNLPRSNHRSGSPRSPHVYQRPFPKPGVNLDETQHPGSIPHGWPGNPGILPGGVGAGRGGRTLTSLRSKVFETFASASSAIPARDVPLESVAGPRGPAQASVSAPARRRVLRPRDSCN